MSKPIRRTAAAVAAALALGIGSAVWAASSASAASAGSAVPIAVSDAIPPVCTAGDLAVWVSYDAGSGAAGTW
jgi:ABC-type nitrate/sulfonate/bicarbonate transport system permease component